MDVPSGAKSSALAHRLENSSTSDSGSPVSVTSARASHTRPTPRWIASGTCDVATSSISASSTTGRGFAIARWPSRRDSSSMRSTRSRSRSDCSWICCAKRSRSSARQLVAQQLGRALDRGQRALQLVRQRAHGVLEALAILQPLAHLVDGHGQVAQLARQLRHRHALAGVHVRRVGLELAHRTHHPDRHQHAHRGRQAQQPEARRRRCGAARGR